MLLDGPIEERDGQSSLSAALESSTQLALPKPTGASACFNRLHQAQDADVYVFLKSGSLVSPGWLHHLLAALEEDPRNGLVGPSTNLSWNQQAIRQRCRDSDGALASAAREVAAKYRGSWKTLEPLYSLADFCYAVKREVIQAIGGADETLWTRTVLGNGLQHSRGQSGFRRSLGTIGIRLSSPNRRVEECPQYQIARAEQAPLPGQVLRTSASEQISRHTGTTAAAMPVRISRPPVASRWFGSSNRSLPILRQSTIPHCLPTIRCVPTLDPKLVPQRLTPPPWSVALCQPQTGPPTSCNRYAIWSDNPTHATSSSSLMTATTTSKRVCLTEIGFATSAAPAVPALAPNEIRPANWRAANSSRTGMTTTGTGRIASKRQLTPLLEGADICGLRDCIFFFELPKWKFWTTSARLHRRLFMEDTHGGTLVYRRSVWDQLARYPNRSLAEDGYFLRAAMKKRARLSRLAANESFLYVKHAKGAWSLNCGQYLDPKGWKGDSHTRLSH